MSRPRFLFLTGLVLLAALSRVVCCTNAAYLDESFVGKNIDADFVASLPTDVDLCDENPEFHSFAFAGPIFKEPVGVQVGEKVLSPPRRNASRRIIDFVPVACGTAHQGILVLRPATRMIPYLGWGRFRFECSWHERLALHFLSALSNGDGVRPRLGGTADRRHR